MLQNPPPKAHSCSSEIPSRTLIGLNWIKEHSRYNGKENCLVRDMPESRMRILKINKKERKNIGVRNRWPPPGTAPGGEEAQAEVAQGAGDGVQDHHRAVLPVAVHTE